MKYAILYHPRTFHEKNYRYFYIPYSIVSVATTLEPSVPCLLYDNNVLRCENPGDLSLPPPSEWALVCISAMVGHQIVDALRFAGFVRSNAPSCPIIWGGSCPTMLVEQVLSEAPVDYAVMGQGEVTIKELWQAISSGTPAEAIQGIAFMRNGQVYRTKPRAITDLNLLPPYRPFFNTVGVWNYIRSDEHIAERTVNYHSSQGCAFTCGFCSEPYLWSNRWTGLAAERIIADLTPLVEDSGVNGIKFYDSEFFIRLDRAMRFAELVVTQRLSFKWGASIHPRNFMKLSDSQIDLLSRSGLSRLLMGAETAVQEEIDLIDKNIDPAMVREAARRCASAGIVASFTFVTGYPGFPPTHIDRTLEFAEELASLSAEHEAKVHFYGPYPGTALYPTALANGFRPPRSLRDWADYDYYYIQTPWIPDEYFDKVRIFNERHYPYLTATEMV